MIDIVLTFEFGHSITIFQNGNFWIKSIILILNQHYPQITFNLLYDLLTSSFRSCPAQKHTPVLLSTIDCVSSEVMADFRLSRRVVSISKDRMFLKIITTSEIYTMQNADC